MRGYTPAFITKRRSGVSDSTSRQRRGIDRELDREVVGSCGAMVGRCGLDVSSQRRHRMPRIKFISDRCFVCRLLGRKHSACVQVIGRDYGSRQRPFMLVAPVSTNRNPSLWGLVSVPSTHNEDSHRRLTVDPVIDPLQPVIKPPLLKLKEINAGLGPELRLARIAEPLSAMPPWPDD